MIKGLQQEQRATWQAVRKATARLRIPNTTAVKELYGGQANVTKAALAGGKMVGKTKDIKAGDDLLLPSVQAQTLRELEDEDPALTIIAFPCEYLSGINNFLPERQRRRRLQQ